MPAAKAAKVQQADLGPKERRAHTVVRRRGDPDAPNRTILRAEVWCLHHALWAEGRLSDAQHEAADRLAMAVELIHGGGSGLGDGGRADPHTRLPISPRAQRAARDLADAREVLQGDCDAVCAAVAARAPHDAAGRALLVAMAARYLPAMLQRLADRWGME
jgi:hypothetical protein